MSVNNPYDLRTTNDSGKMQSDQRVEVPRHWLERVHGNLKDSPDPTAQRMAREAQDKLRRNG